MLIRVKQQNYSLLVPFILFLHDFVEAGIIVFHQRTVFNPQLCYTWSEFKIISCKILCNLHKRKKESYIKANGKVQFFLLYFMISYFYVFPSTQVITIGKSIAQYLVFVLVSTKKNESQDTTFKNSIAETDSYFRINLGS